MAQSMREQKPRHWHFQLLMGFSWHAWASLLHETEEYRVYVPLLCPYCKTHMLPSMSGKLRNECRQVNWELGNECRQTCLGSVLANILFCPSSVQNNEKNPTAVFAGATHWKKGYFSSFLQESYFCWGGGFRCISHSRFSTRIAFLSIQAIHHTHTSFCVSKCPLSALASLAGKPSMN